MNFLDRTAETAVLAEAWDRAGAGLLILYGRRRVGKTELLRHFASGRRHVFFVATQASSAFQLRSFSSAVRQGLGDEAAGVSFSDWGAAFQFLASRSRNERILVVLDEFPYLVEAEPALPSLLQSAWDSELKGTEMLLALCGSSISFMESEVLGHRSPLFGRRTGQFLLEPLEYREAALFFPGRSAEELVERYALLGGMPAYLQQFADIEDLWDGVARRILRKGAFLHDEVPFLLMQELRDPRLYLSVLAALAEGRTRIGEIAQRALGPGTSSQASFYLKTLQDLRLVERRVPITETSPGKSRKGLYRIVDPFLRFWMRFVYSEASAVEGGEAGEVIEQVLRPVWSDFVAPVFEQICRQHVRRSPQDLGLEWRPAVVGSWWSPQGELDLVATDSRRTRLLCGECKWSTRAVGVDVLDSLRDKALRLGGELGTKEIRLALFARRGFTEAVRRRAREEGVRLVVAGDLYGS